MAAEKTGDFVRLRVTRSFDNLHVGDEPETELDDVVWGWLSAHVVEIKEVIRRGTDTARSRTARKDDSGGGAQGPEDESAAGVEPSEDSGPGADGPAEGVRAD